MQTRTQTSGAIWRRVHLKLINPCSFLGFFPISLIIQFAPVFLTYNAERGGFVYQLKKAFQVEMFLMTESEMYPFWDHHCSDIYNRWSSPADERVNRCCQLHGILIACQMDGDDIQMQKVKINRKNVLRVRNPAKIESRETFWKRGTVASNIFFW